MDRFLSARSEAGERHVYMLIAKCKLVATFDLRYPWSY
jgi:hypothetical protein